MRAGGPHACQWARVGRRRWARRWAALRRRWPHAGGAAPECVGAQTLPALMPKPRELMAGCVNSSEETRDGASQGGRGGSVLVRAACCGGSVSTAPCSWTRTLTCNLRFGGNSTQRCRSPRAQLRHAAHQWPCHPQPRARPRPPRTCAACPTRGAGERTGFGGKQEDYLGTGSAEASAHGDVRGEVRGHEHAEM